MIQLDLTYDDLRKIGATFRRPEASLTVCCQAPNGGLRITVLANVAKLADLGRMIPSLMVSITLDLELKPVGGGRIEIDLLDLSLDKSEAPLLARPFLRPGTFKKVLFEQISKQPHLVANPDTGTVLIDVNTIDKLRKRDLTAEITQLEIGPDGVAIGLTLAD